MPTFGRRQSNPEIAAHRAQQESSVDSKAVDQAEDLNSRWDNYRQSMLDSGALDPNGRWVNAENLSREQRDYLLKLQQEHIATESTETVSPEDEVTESNVVQLNVNESAESVDPDELQAGKDYLVKGQHGLVTARFLGRGEDTGDYQFVTPRGAELLKTMNFQRVVDLGEEDGVDYAFRVPREDVPELAKAA